MHLSKTTEETVNLAVRDDTDIVFVSRFMSRHVLDNDVIIGTRLLAYCTAPKIAILSCLPSAEAHTILSKSNLHPFTLHTTGISTRSAPSSQSRRRKATPPPSRSIATAIFQWRPPSSMQAAQPLARSISASRATGTRQRKRKSGLPPLVIAAVHSISLVSGARR